MGLFGIGDKVVEKVADTANNAIRQLPTNHNKALDAKEIIEANKEQDLIQAKASEDANLKNPKYWLEVICVIAFAYNYLLVPVIDDAFGLQLKGIINEQILDNLLYALLGLGGYRIGSKIADKIGK